MALSETASASTNSCVVPSGVGVGVPLYIASHLRTLPRLLLLHRVKLVVGALSEMASAPTPLCAVPRSAGVTSFPVDTVLTGKQHMELVAGAMSETTSAPTPMLVVPMMAGAGGDQTIAVIATSVLVARPTSTAGVTSALLALPPTTVLQVPASEKAYKNLS
jgi:uncharacterized membrane protein YfcA